MSGTSSFRGGWWLAFALVAVVVLSLPAFVGASWVDLATLIGIFSIAAIGLDITWGYGGMLSLGHGAFFGLGAYATAMLTVYQGWSPLASMGTGLLVCAGASSVLALLCSRLELLDVALATMAFTIAIESLLRGLRDVTGGGGGITGVPPFEVAGFSFTGTTSIYFLVWGTCLVVLAGAGNLVHSHIGRSYRATNEDELIAAAASINTFWVKIQSFVIGAVICSLAGSLYAHYLVYVSPRVAGFLFSAELLTMVILGGQGSLFGAIIGVGVFELLPEVLAGFDQYELVFKGTILIVLLLFFPRGIVGFVNLIRRWVGNLISGDRSSPES